MRICKVDGATQGALVDDELILIDTRTGSFFALRGTGLQVWNLLDSHHELEMIQQALAAEYEVDAATCEREVSQFANQLVEAGFARYC